MLFSLKLFPLILAAVFVLATLAGLGELKAARQVVGRRRQDYQHGAFWAFAVAAVFAGLLIVLYPVIVKVIALGAVIAAFASIIYLNIHVKPRLRAAETEEVKKGHGFGQSGRS